MITHRSFHGFCILIVALLAAVTDATAEPAAVDLGSRRELFVDRHLIDRLDGAALVLARPVDAGPVLAFDHPLEGPFCAYVTVIKDGPKYRMYYRGFRGTRIDNHDEEVTCVAESADGIAWKRPSLGRCEVNGSKDNHVVLANARPFAHNFSPFLDARPDVPAAERYKALAGAGSSGLAVQDVWRREKERAELEALRKKVAELVRK